MGLCNVNIVFPPMEIAIDRFMRYKASDTFWKNLPCLYFGHPATSSQSIKDFIAQQGTHVLQWTVSYSGRLLLTFYGVEY